ncbi:MAG: TIGR01777 family oxidoreductase [Bacteroidota bacterium]
MPTILIGGGTGFIGMHLSRRLRDLGHNVRHLSRRKRPEAEFPTFQWDVVAQTIDDAAFTDVDYVINLAGAGIADARWTEKRKQVIINSRVNSTGLLAASFARLGVKPKLYLSASAIGYYGDRGEATLTEEAKPGTGFLSKSCILWEESVAEVTQLGIPTFINRTGIVLHPKAGALQKMLIPLNFWTSTYFGDGQQFYSWIHVEDLVETYAHAIQHDLTGVYNCTAPHPVRNKPFAQALGPAIGKSALTIPAPAFALKMALGEMSHTVLDSCRCSPKKLLGTGFVFRHPELPEALKDLLG